MGSAPVMRAVSQSHHYRKSPRLGLATRFGSFGTIRSVHMERLGSLWIFTPVYFDVESFVRLREEILSELKKHELKFNSLGFVVVDDSAGVDPAIAGLEGLGDVSVVSPPFNLGHQRALVYALRTAREE